MCDEHSRHDPNQEDDHDQGDEPTPSPTAQLEVAFLEGAATCATGLSLRRGEIAGVRHGIDRMEPCDPTQGWCCEPSSPGGSETQVPSMANTFVANCAS